MSTVKPFWAGLSEIKADGDYVVLTQKEANADLPRPFWPPTV